MLAKVTSTTRKTNRKIDLLQFRLDIKFLKQFKLNQFKSWLNLFYHL
jgi:hypothetical protein